MVSVPLVEIKPITLLVGRNSSGKSSFLRAFPLVRQSLMTKTSSPLLWYGEFVDFGSFEGAVTDNDLEREISFSFGVSQLNVPDLTRPYYHSPEFMINDVNLEVAITSAREQATSANEKTQIASLRLNFNDGSMRYFMRLNSQGQVAELSLNDESILGFFAEFEMVFTQGTIFPELLLRPRQPSSPPRIYSPHQGNLYAAVGKLIAPHLDSRIKSDRLDSYSEYLLSMPDFSKEYLLRLYNNITAARSFKSLLVDLAEKDTKGLFSKLQLIYTANRFVPTLNRVSQHLRDTISNTLYIGPARARSERYYRYQDLSVSEIDADGKNFPMFLNSLGPKQLDGLSNWVEELFNYRIEIKPSAGHLSINLIEGSHSTNIADTGYGVSQILPVLGQIWWAANRPSPAPSFFRPSRLVPRAQKNSSILAIEQPELHLHPAHQALLADAFAAQSNRDSDDVISFLIETHSETLVNRLGELIAQGRLKPEFVQILIFEPSKEDDRVTEVSVAHFGDQGELIDWPYGFFQPAALT
jgi:AAA ATPase domain